MEKLKSSLTNMLTVLTVITIVAAGVLASVNAVTAPQIEKINAENLSAGIKAVMGSDDIQVSEPWEVDAFTVYDINDKEGNLLGKAIVTTENGFGGPLKVLVGFNRQHHDKQDIDESIDIHAHTNLVENQRLHKQQHYKVQYVFQFVNHLFFCALSSEALSSVLSLFLIAYIYFMLWKSVYSSTSMV